MKPDNIVKMKLDLDTSEAEVKLDRLIAKVDTLGAKWLNLNEREGVQSSGASCACYVCHKRFTPLPGAATYCVCPECVPIVKRAQEIIDAEYKFQQGTLPVGSPGATGASTLVYCKGGCGKVSGRPFPGSEWRCEKCSDPEGFPPTKDPNERDGSLWAKPAACSPECNPDAWGCEKCNPVGPCYDCGAEGEMYAGSGGHPLCKACSDKDLEITEEIGRHIIQPETPRYTRPLEDRPKYDYCIKCNECFKPESDEMLCPICEDEGNKPGKDPDSIRAAAKTIPCNCELCKPKHQIGKDACPVQD